MYRCMFLKNGFTHGLNYPKLAGRRTFLANTHLVQKVVIEISYVDIPRLRGPPALLKVECLRCPDIIT